jgi:L-aspartate oxidase
LEAGIDMTRQPIPVVPAAHYMCGGVVTDLDGRTDLEGLYASGEVAMTGFHGANRLASNSLLEALVMAKRAFLHAIGASRPPAAAVAWEPPTAAAGSDPAAAAPLRERLRRVMWEQVGIIRSDRGLERANAEVDELATRVDLLYRGHAPESHLGELRNLVTVGRLVASAARRRRESRGGHYNEDHPVRDDARWGRPILLDRRALDRA